ncbi:hypothetical protein AKJ16_DCAP10389 [Drosera capensis]
MNPKLVASSNVINRILLRRLNSIFPLRKRPSSAGSYKSSSNALQEIVSGGKIWEMKELEQARKTEAKAKFPSMQQHRLYLQ